MAPFSSGFNDTEFENVTFSEDYISDTSALDITMIAVLTAVFTFIMVVGLLENVIVLIVFVRRPHLRTLSNRFVINLLCANIISCFVLIPITAFDSAVVWSGWEPDLAWSTPMCHVADCVAALVAAGSIFATLWIAIDQYYAVTNPLHYHTIITKLRCVGFLSGSWILACAFGVLAGIPVVNNASNFGGFCRKSQVDTEHSVLFVFIFGLCVFVIPITLLIFLYTQIYSAAHKNSKRTRVSNATEIPKEEIHIELYHSTNNSRASSFRNTSSQLMSSLRYRISNASLFLYREEGRAAKISIIVLGVALFCWLPYFITMILHSFNREVPHIIDSLSLLVTGLNSVLSPFIYAYRSQRLLREVKRLFNLPPFNKPKIRRSLTRNRRFLSNRHELDINEKKSVVISQSTNIIIDEKDDDFDEEDFCPLSLPVSTDIDDNTKAKIISLVCDKHKSYCSKWKNSCKPPNFELGSVSSGENSRSSFSSATTQGTASTTDTEV